MKKLFAILLVAALLLPVLAGCQSSEQQSPATTPPAVSTPETTAPAETTPETTAPADEYITREEAKAIALKDAGLAEADVRDLEVELDRDDGPVHYDVDFEKGSDDYDYDIDAKTGEILLVKKPAAATSSESTQKPASSGSSSSGSSSSGSSSSGSSSSGSSSKQLTKAEAKAIAFKHAGVKESEVRDLDVELDRDDGTLHYDVDFEQDGYDYEYEINAASGKILKSRKERD